MPLDWQPSNIPFFTKVYDFLIKQKIHRTTYSVIFWLKNFNDSPNAWRMMFILQIITKIFLAWAPWCLFGSDLHYGSIHIPPLATLNFGEYLNMPGLFRPFCCFVHKVLSNENGPFHLPNEHLISVSSFMCRKTYSSLNSDQMSCLPWSLPCLSCSKRTDQWQLPYVPFLI